VLAIRAEYDAHMQNGALPNGFFSQTGRRYNVYYGAIVKLCRRKANLLPTCRIISYASKRFTNQGRPGDAPINFFTCQVNSSRVATLKSVGAI